MTTRKEDSGTVVVHIMFRGQVLCGFDRRPPAYWPEPHRWAGVANAAAANCGECLRRASSMEEVARQVARAMETPIGGRHRG